ncbi:phosphatidate phosphatase pah2 [Phtheirospermum japonicum]|uniref:Phosphatidate phosphatase pah2 n=1 Tax=Phtheirospermum japonicum TaxID=374723 RepID=A0A830C6L2_9LAMI|nr:phosphatidate phosphatase pah2 [Phtheirospermum japonicum]
MQAVGRIGSYISRSVYSVSGPFHPFGGAVDIIVVEQPDGTYKSSPWYVRFGKFQGVLKTKEKVVSISVNGVEADFHMYLNHKGEAYFLKEVDEEDLDSLCSTPSSFVEDADKITNRPPLKPISCNYDYNCSENERNAAARSDSRPSQIFGLVFGRKSMKDEENESGDFRTESLERAEIAADLLDLKWSTNLDTPRRKKDNDNDNNNNNASRFSTADISKDEMGLVSHSSYIVETEKVTSLSNSETDQTGLAKSEVHVCSASLIPEVSKPDSRIEGSVEKLKEDQFTLVHEERVSISEGTTCNGSESIVTEYSQVVSIVSREDEINKRGSSEGLLVSGNQESRISDKEQLLCVNEPCDTKCCSGFSLDQSVINDYIKDVDPQRIRLRAVSSEPCIQKTGHDGQSEDVTRIVRSSTGVGPLSNKLEASDKHQSPEDGFADSSTGVFLGTPPRPIDSLNGNQRSWPFPFQRSKSTNISQVKINSVENPNTAEVLYNSSDLEACKDVSEAKEYKKTFIRTLAPTSEQLASLNLKEGKNTVDARIFMWRWDTRIVISDVDGTITRSDLLGQVMPLVGMDWSQTGVAHLFSAIKENGYQLLFLSARSIAQSFITRQFLFNIKQDGKALPEGPVVISPDGLFPSLFREVVRRAPHEFKIACLEDIKALFPADTNPFYAGFGNRDTDEFSYLKVGIPRGKIFIINPKGEIVVNRRVDTKSYLSLHALGYGGTENIILKHDYK